MVTVCAGKIQRAIVVYNDGSTAINVTENEINAAYALLTAGKKNDSLKAFKSLLARAHENLNIMNGTGLALQMNGQHKDAISLFEALLNKGGDTAWVLHNISVSYAGLHDLVAAEIAEERAVQLDPDNYEFLFSLGTIRVYLGKFDGTKELISRLIEARPQDGRGYMMMAELARKQIKPSTAFETIKEAAHYAELSYQVDPQKWHGRKLLALCYLYMGRLDKAVMTAIGLWPVRVGTG